MKRGTFEYIEQALIDYSEVDRYIEKRVEELKYPVVDIDENIGGGESNKVSDPTAKLAITIADDRLIRNLRRTKDIIAKVLEELPPKKREVIELYYIRKPRKYTWAGVAIETNYNERHCRRIRNEVFKILAEELGLPID